MNTDRLGTNAMRQAVYKRPQSLGKGLGPEGLVVFDVPCLPFGADDDMLRHLAKGKGESIVHSGNGSQVAPAAADPTNAWAEYVNAW
jgi:hypothetical protein